MKIKNPNIQEGIPERIDFEGLLMEARQEDSDIINCRIRDVFLDEAELDRIYFRGVVFENCHFMHCDFEKAGFLDVRFCNCDFSNSVFADSYFNRCQIEHCKWMGADMRNSYLQHMVIADSNFQMVNFDHGKLEYISMAGTSMQHAVFSEVKWKSMEVNRIIFNGASFFKTRLKGLDFTQCEIDGIVLSDTYSELEGAVVSPVQAVELAKLLRVIVK